MTEFFMFVIFVFVGAFGAAVIWPWMGPSLYQPCPIATPLGCWFAGLMFALTSVAKVK